MAEDDDDSQKTEEATQKRIEDAIKRGQVPFSREVTNFLVLLVLTLSIVWLAPFLMRYATLSLKHYIEHAHDISIDGAGALLEMKAIMIIMLKTVGLPIIGLIFVAFLSSFLQNGFNASTEPLMPKLSKISPLSGLKRLFSMRSVVEFLKGIVKISIVGTAGVIAVYSKLTALKQAHALSIGGLLILLSELALRVLIAACIVMAVVAVLDYLYQRHDYLKNLRMTRHEVKEEYKQSEGNPEIKAKLKSIRMQRAKSRMMSQVPKADVVITNPTHYSVALKYEDGAMKAPVVVAKGRDKVALKIREVARENDVPIVENPPLARALYKVDLEDEVPIDHYKAVAEVIAYVYKLKNKTHAN